MEHDQPNEREGKASNTLWRLWQDHLKPQQAGQSQQHHQGPWEHTQLIILNTHSLHQGDGQEQDKTKLLHALEPFITKNHKYCKDEQGRKKPTRVQRPC